MVYLKYRSQMQCTTLVLLDVADNNSQEDPNQTKYQYQLAYATCFLFPAWLSTWYLRRRTRNFEKAKPPPIFEQEREDQRRYIHSTAAYPYYYLIRRIITGGLKEVISTSRLSEFNGVPILFVDARPSGEPDPFRFYTKEFKQYIESRREDCEFAVMEDASHWLMWDKPRELNEKLLAFLQK